MHARFRGNHAGGARFEPHQANFDQVAKLPQGIEGPPVRHDVAHRPLSIDRQKRLQRAPVQGQWLFTSVRVVIGD